MSKKFTICILTVFYLLIAINVSFAAIGDLAQRQELGSIDDLKHDRPFHETAVITGKCREVEEGIEKWKHVRWIYRLNNNETKDSKVDLVGAYYVDEHGRKSFCYDDLAFVSFVQKNIGGKKVFLNGLQTLGKTYGLNRKRIILLESLELMNAIPAGESGE